jgi:hypothetical protein
VLFQHKKTLMSMTASLALLAGLTASAEAFPFDWLTNPRPQSNLGRHGTHAAPPAKPAETVAWRDQPSAKDKVAAKDAAGDLAAKAKGVLTIVISLNRQQLTLYSDGVPVARSRVTTGSQTPTGVFSIIQKDRWQHSGASG